MNQQDIIRMAREAKGHAYTNRHLPGEPAFAFSIDRLERFFQSAYAAGAAAEREAIVQMIENVPALLEFATNDQGGCLVCGFTPKLAIAAIRARNKQ